MSAIVYFSRAGENLVGGELVEKKCGVMAQFVQQVHAQLTTKLGVDLPIYQITPQKPYPHGFNDTVVRVDSELTNYQMPEISVDNFNAADHKVVFCGFPIWLGTVATPAISFFKNYDLTNKTIVPLCTSEVSRWGCSLHTLDMFTDGEDVHEGIWVRDTAVGTNVAENLVSNWIEKNKKICDQIKEEMK